MRAQTFDGTVPNIMLREGKLRDVRRCYVSDTESAQE